MNPPGAAVPDTAPIEAERISEIERMVAFALGAGRIAIGVGLWAAPGFAMRVLGFGRPGPETLAIARVAGTRDMLIGAWQLRSIDDRGELARATATAAACDAGDTVAFGLLLAAGNRRAGLRGVAAAAPATIAGVLLARSQRR